VHIRVFNISGSCLLLATKTLLFSNSLDAVNANAYITVEKDCDVIALGSTSGGYVRRRDSAISPLPKSENVWRHD
jgi:hypothetical protein